MTASDRAAALVTWWTTVYTRRLPRQVAQRRQEELASDLWEQRAHARQAGAPALLVALAILRRAIAGIPADLQWRHNQLAAARGNPIRQQRQPMVASRRHTFARTWWLVLAALLGASLIVGSAGVAFLDWQFDASASRPTIWPSLWNAYITYPLSAGGILLLAGLALRPRARVAGDVLLALGALPLLDLYHLSMEMPPLGAVLIPIAPLAVVTMAVLDAAEARSLTHSTLPSRGSSSRWLLAIATILAAGLAATGTRIAVEQLVTGGRVVVALMYATAVITLLAAIGRRPSGDHHTTR